MATATAASAENTQGWAAWTQEKTSQACETGTNLVKSAIDTGRTYGGKLITCVKEYSTWGLGQLNDLATRFFSFLKSCWDQLKTTTIGAKVGEYYAKYPNALTGFGIVAAVAGVWAIAANRSSSTDGDANASQNNENPPTEANPTDKKGGASDA